MSLYSREPGYDVFDEEDSDSDIEKSSEDEIDIILHGTLEQKRKLQKKDRQVARRLAGASKGNLSKQLIQDDSSSEDEFEKEMNAELEQNVRSLEQSRGRTAQLSITASEGETISTSAAPTDEKAGRDFYDQIYFDSDEEEMDNSEMGGNQHSVISNDDLLYDPNMDDEDQKWVDHQRLSHRANAGVKPRGQQDRGRKKKMPNSDALLDCPACMTTLCIDCQRHDSYKHQFRAMFVMNCTVNYSETLQCPEQIQKKKKKKKKNTAANENTEPATVGAADMFHPVQCTECDTVVGVIDREEVYHFFNVLASHT